MDTVGRRARGGRAGRVLGAVAVAMAVGAVTAPPAGAVHGGEPVGGCNRGFVLIDTVDDPSSPGFRDRNEDLYLCRNAHGAYTDNNR